MSTDYDLIDTTEPGLQAEDLGRAYGYRLLGKLLAAPPDEALLAYLRQIPEDGNDGGSSESLFLAWQAIRMAAEVTTVRSVDDEYHALFIGVGRGELMPFGSWYMTGFLMDQPLSVLRQDLKVLGFERQEGVKEPEDHIAALCETMSMIVEDDDISDKAQATFYRKHLAGWSAKFFEDLAEAESARFYTSVARFGGEFFDQESQFFGLRH